MSSLDTQFRNFISSLGLECPEELIADGKLHRFNGSGRRGDKSCFYIFHADGIPAGCVGDWRSDLKETWKASLPRPLTEDERKRQKARIDAQRRMRNAQIERDRAEAKAKAERIWGRAASVESHPYLDAKCVRGHGLRMYRGRLIVPVIDAEGELTSLQFIAESGVKRFLGGGAVAGGSCLLGDPAGASAIVICEGWATGASIFEATGLPVYVAFNAGNLLAVAKQVRSRYPAAQLIIGADDDTWTEGNPGLTKAREAAQAVIASLAVPDFGPCRIHGDTDFNDLARRVGKDAVTRQVLLARLVDTPDGRPTAEASSNSNSPIPSAEQRPRFVVFDDRVEHDGVKYRAGVWYFGVKSQNSGPPQLFHQWICSPLHIDAATADQLGGNVGRLLRFRGISGHWRELAIPMELLKGDCADVRGELMSLGLETSLAARALLTEYLLRPAPNRRVRCVPQVGWASPDCFVLPDEVIAADQSDVILQSSELAEQVYTQSGTLAEWQDTIGRMANDNPMMQLAIAVALAGPLLERVGGESGGTHYVGDSSCGKTTLIDAGRSVWGGASFRRSWRTTASGLEGAACLFNDTVLVLDEIQEADPREVGSIVYSLGNGVGKQRASRSGRARTPMRWKNSILSSGERSVGSVMREAGQQIKAGQTVRLLDIPAKRKHGAWDCLHEFPDGSSFADAIKAMAGRYYGTAGRAFLAQVVKPGQDLAGAYEMLKALPAFSPDQAEGQVRRAGARFALFALAGELAIEYGVTPWPKGSAIDAAQIAFDAWRVGRSSGNSERHQVLQALAAFLDRHGDSRFSALNESRDQTNVMRIHRAGWWEHCKELGRIYLFTGDGLQEALTKFDWNSAMEVLRQAKVIPEMSVEADGTRRYGTRKYIGGERKRVYRVFADTLAEVLDD